MSLPHYTPLEFDGVVEEVVTFVREQRDRMGPHARHLAADERKKFSPYFTPQCLDAVLVVCDGTRVEEPAFAKRARAKGFSMMPTYAHLPEITLGDLIVIQARLTDRLLFHAMVHTMQYYLLGVELYVELYLRAFVRSGLHVTVPLEVHAYELDRRFAADPTQPFSVEHEVRAWVKQNRYAGAVPGPRLA